MGIKTYLDTNVYEAAIRRLHTIYDQFEHVMVSFSGGKDSTVLLHLAVQVAEERGRLPVHAMFIDLEGQYRETIRHVAEMFDDPRVAGTWFCIPLNLRNAVSSYQPFWACWDPGEQEQWVRPLPVHPTVVSDPSSFPFYRYRMEFEEFDVEYEEWLAGQLGGSLACLIGIRSDESLNRVRVIKRENVRRWQGHKWTHAWRPNVINAYPIYDWRVDDIWTYLGKNALPYNRLYDWMYLHGTSIHDQRICQPYGDDQRVSLDQFHAIEPDTWFRILERVQGVNYGARYAGLGRSGAEKRMLGYAGGLGLPEGHTWETYARTLLASLPNESRALYLVKINSFLKWWARYCGEQTSRFLTDAEDVFDNLGLYQSSFIPWDGYTGAEAPDKPEWRDSLWMRIARCILRHDFLGKTLSIGQTKNQFEKLSIIQKKYADL
jgi:predicted phosphoadenosine phosphosulfate sulfurtransferase